MSISQYCVRKDDLTVSINLSPSESNEGGESIALINVLVRFMVKCDTKSSPVPTEGSEEGVDSAESPVENTEVGPVESPVETTTENIEVGPVVEPGEGFVKNTTENTEVGLVENTETGSVENTTENASTSLEASASQEGPKIQLAPVSSTDVQEMPADDDTLIVMDSDDSDEVDTTTAATLNDLALHSLQRRARLLSANTQDSCTPSHTRHCLSEDLSLSSPPPHSPLESTFKYCPILQLLHEGDVRESYSIHL